MKNENDFFTVLGETFNLIGESWQALKFNLVSLISVAFLPLLIILLAAGIIVGIIAINNNSAGITASILVGLISLLIVLLFVPAVTIVQLKSAMKEKIGFESVFKSSRKIFLPFIGLLFMSGLITVIGFILLIIPGVLASFYLSMSAYIFLDKQTGVIESLKQSYRLTKKHWRWILALLCVNWAISLPSYIPFIGWIVSMALSVAYFCLPAIIYVKIRNK